MTDTIGDGSEKLRALLNRAKTQRKQRRSLSKLLPDDRRLLLESMEPLPGVSPVFMPGTPSEYFGSASAGGVWFPQSVPEGSIDFVVYTCLTGVSSEQAEDCLVWSPTEDSTKSILDGTTSYLGQTANNAKATTGEFVDGPLSPEFESCIRASLPVLDSLHVAEASVVVRVIPWQRMLSDFEGDALLAINFTTQQMDAGLLDPAGSNALVVSVPKREFVVGQAKEKLEQLYDLHGTECVDGLEALMSFVDAAGLSMDFETDPEDTSAVDNALAGVPLWRKSESQRNPLQNVQKLGNIAASDVTDIVLYPKTEHDLVDAAVLAWLDDEDLSDLPSNHLKHDISLPPASLKTRQAAVEGEIANVSDTLFQIACIVTYSVNCAFPSVETLKDREQLWKNVNAVVDARGLGVLCFTESCDRIGRLALTRSEGRRGTDGKPVGKLHVRHSATAKADSTSHKVDSHVGNLQIVSRILPTQMPVVPEGEKGKIDEIAKHCSGRDLLQAVDTEVLSTLVATVRTAMQAAINQQYAGLGRDIGLQQAVTDIRQVLTGIGFTTRCSDCGKPATLSFHEGENAIYFSHSGAGTHGYSQSIPSLELIPYTPRWK